MQSKFSVIALSAVAMMFLACGGGGSGSTSTTTGTGYYIDSAVAGVSYECGTQKGVTDENGKFIFDKNQGCKFSLAGVPLREINASNLEDGVKVVETDPKVARFLQSLDNDGNASNGIQISDEVIAILTDALMSVGSENRVPEGTEVESFVDKIAESVVTYHGSAKTAEEVADHLENTLLSLPDSTLSEALVLGKKYYLPQENSYQRNDGQIVCNNHVETYVFGANNVLNMSWTQDNGDKSMSFTYQISENTLNLSGFNGDSYINADLRFENTYNGNLYFSGGWTLYSSESDAQAHLPKDGPDCISSKTAGGDSTTSSSNSSSGSTA